jgi:hypothetical protein
MGSSQCSIPAAASAAAGVLEPKHSAAASTAARNRRPVVGPAAWGRAAAHHRVARSIRETEAEAEDEQAQDAPTIEKEPAEE